MNIFDNAVKYNARENKEIVVTTFSDRKALHMAIADNGIGMTREGRKHFFEKFLQLVERHLAILHPAYLEANDLQVLFNHIPSMRTDGLVSLRIPFFF